MIRGTGISVVLWSVLMVILLSAYCTVASEGRISEEVAVVTELPLAVEVTHWDVSLETDLPSNRLKLKAVCTVRNKGGVPVESLDFDILAAERFYGVQVEIARIARLTGDKQAAVSFKRFIEEPPDDPGLAGTHKYPLVTRMPLSPALQREEECRLVFDYTVTCLNIARRRHYNLIWEPEEGRKEICLISDFTWFPALATDLQKWMELAGDKNFFPRDPKPAWRISLTHPFEHEGMVIDGKLEGSDRVGERTTSQWKSITGGRPQVFIGPAERIEKKDEGVTVVFLLPRSKYDPEFVDALGDLAVHAYHVYTEWFGPLDSHEVHIVATSGIGGGHGAFLGMTVAASYFQTKKGARINESGKFFAQTVPHELAHAWWGHSLSSYGRGTKFLRESLANFSTWHLAREYYGMDIFKSTLQRLIERGQADKPLFNATYDEEQFAYEKGPLVLDLLRQEMGDAVFFQTLKEYVRRHRDAAVTFVDFVSVCNDVSGRDWMPVFEKLGQVVAEHPVHRQAIALIWQGHMLDLLGRRDEAISRYQKVVDMDTKREIEIRHDQFGLAYHPSRYASERMTTPFTRVENQQED